MELPARLTLLRNVLSYNISNYDFDLQDYCV